MGFVDAIKSGFAHYVKFDGRANRAMYWWWTLFVVLVAIVGVIIDVQLSSGVISALIGLALFLPGLSVAIRRLHDTDKTGWFILLALIPLVGTIILLVFFLMPGTQGANRFGEQP